MTVRSKRLGKLNVTPGDFRLLYTCPAGRTGILKEFSLVPSGPGVARAVLAVVSGGDFAYIFDDALGRSIVGPRLAFVVLEPGDTIQVFCQGAAIFAWCWGAELDGVAP